MSCRVVRYCLYVVLFFLSSVIIEAQNENNIEQLISEMLEEMAADGLLSADGDEAQELYEFSQNKLDLNSASADELRRLHILTDEQIEALVKRRYLMGKFETPQELCTIPGFEEWFVLRLLNFVTIEDRDVQLKGHKFKGDIYLRIGRLFPDVAGLKPKNNSVGAPYLGDPYKGLLRLRMSLDENWSVGAVAEKDAGEPLFSHGISTADFTSAYIAYENKRKPIARAVIGHYSARFGQGLGLWTGFSTDASSVQTSIDRNGVGIRPSMSASEYGYLRGAAIMLVKNRWQATLFGSHTDNDATIFEDDDTTVVRIQSIQQDGYHRTKNELAGRNNVEILTYGGYLAKGFNKSNIGIGANYWHTSKELCSSDELYKINYPAGKYITTIHGDYHSQLRKVRLYGEMAFQKSNVTALAFMQAIDITLGGGNYLTLAYRNFGKHYYAAQQNPFSKAGKPGGESGVYIGLQISPFSSLSVLANANVYRNSWLTYQKLFPSDGYKLRLKASYMITSKTTIEFRARLDRNDVASSADRYQMEREHRTSYKILLSSTPLPILRFRTQAEHVHHKEEGQPGADGFWIAEDIKLSLNKPDLTVIAMMAHFDTDNYDSRIYTYLPDLLYSMSIPSYSGRGVLAVMQVKYGFLRNFEIAARAHLTHYYDRTEIGSGNQMTDGRNRLDVRVQLRAKLYKYFKRKRIANVDFVQKE